MKAYISLLLGHPVFNNLENYYKCPRQLTEMGNSKRERERETQMESLDLKIC